MADPHDVLDEVLAALRQLASRPLLCQEDPKFEIRQRARREGVQDALRLVEALIEQARKRAPAAEPSQPTPPPPRTAEGSDS